MWLAAGVISGVIHDLHHHPGPASLTGGLHRQCGITRGARQIAIVPHRIRVGRQNVAAVEVSVQLPGFVQHLESRMIAVKSLYLQVFSSILSRYSGPSSSLMYQASRLG